MPRVVLDAFPLLVYFHRQDGWAIVEELLDEAVEQGYNHLISSINLGEIYYTLLRDFGDSVAEDTLLRILDGPIDVVVPDLDTTLLAARFKAGGGISYADCFAGALSSRSNVPVLTGDREFARLETYGVRIHWISKLS